MKQLNSSGDLGIHFESFLHWEYQFVFTWQSFYIIHSFFSPCSLSDEAKVTTVAMALRDPDFKKSCAIN